MGSASSSSSPSFDDAVLAQPGRASPCEAFPTSRQFTKGSLQQVATFAARCQQEPAVAWRCLRCPLLELSSNQRQQSRQVLVLSGAKDPSLARVVASCQKFGRRKQK